jgi:hypothetical protein
MGGILLTEIKVRPLIQILMLGNDDRRRLSFVCCYSHVDKLKLMIE